jgi:hypothetical protein
VPGAVLGAVFAAVFAAVTAAVVPAMVSGNEAFLTMEPARGVTGRLPGALLAPGTLYEEFARDAAREPGREGRVWKEGP